MRVIKKHRYDDGSVLRIVEDNGIYTLNKLTGTNSENLAESTLEQIEALFAEASGVQPVVVDTLETAENVDCANDPCTAPDCDCEPVAAPAEPEPFNE